MLCSILFYSILGSASPHRSVILFSESDLGLRGNLSVSLGREGMAEPPTIYFCIIRCVIDLPLSGTANFILRLGSASPTAL